MSPQCEILPRLKGTRRLVGACVSKNYPRQCVAACWSCLAHPKHASLALWLSVEPRNSFLLSPTGLGLPPTHPAQCCGCFVNPPTSCLVVTCLHFILMPFQLVWSTASPLAWILSHVGLRHNYSDFITWKRLNEASGILHSLSSLQHGRLYIPRTFKYLLIFIWKKK